MRAGDVDDRLDRGAARRFRHGARNYPFKRNLLRCLAAPWRRRAAINALHARDDRTLRDIGLARDQIETAIAELERIRRTRQSCSHWV